MKTVAQKNSLYPYFYYWISVVWFYVLIKMCGDIEKSITLLQIQNFKMSIVSKSSFFYEYNRFYGFDQVCYSFS